jgi:hypothetical protein
MTLLTQVLARDTNVANLEVSAAPPDDDSGQLPNVISVHLFHVAEDAHSKNWTNNMAASSPVQHTEMGLVLYYVVTARSTADEFGGSGRALIEQRLLGYVVRAFHDYPVIDDDTVIPSIPPQPPNQPLLETTSLQGAGNQIQIILRPVGVDETINFWSAEQDNVPRLSLFYEVRLIRLSTPPAEGAAPPVLSVADFVSVGPKLVLLSARSLLGFALPAGHPLADPTTPFRFIVANPARITLFPPGLVPATVPPSNNRVTLEGAGFQSDRTQVALEGPAAVGAGAPATQRITLDLGDPANIDWSISQDGTRISLGFRTTVTSADAQAYTLYPGIYRVRVIVGTQISDAPAPRFLEQSSADVAFAVAPQIVSIASAGGPANASRFAISLFGAYLRHELDVRLNVAGQVLQRDPDPTIAGNFDFAVNTGVIDFAVDTTALASPIPVQLIINGAEAPPAWSVF